MLSLLFDARSQMALTASLGRPARRGGKGKGEGAPKKAIVKLEGKKAATASGGKGGKGGKLSSAHHLMVFYIIRAPLNGVLYNPRTI